MSTNTQAGLPPLNKRGQSGGKETESSNNEETISTHQHDRMAIVNFFRIPAVILILMAATGVYESGKPTDTGTSTTGSGGNRSSAQIPGDQGHPGDSRHIDEPQPASSPTPTRSPHPTKYPSPTPSPTETLVPSDTPPPTDTATALPPTKTPTPAPTATPYGYCPGPTIPSEARACTVWFGDKPSLTATEIMLVWINNFQNRINGQNQLYWDANTGKWIVTTSAKPDNQGPGCETGKFDLAKDIPAGLKNAPGVWQTRDASTFSAYDRTMMRGEQKVYLIFGTIEENNSTSRNATLKTIPVTDAKGNVVYGGGELVRNLRYCDALIAHYSSDGYQIFPNSIGLTPTQIDKLFPPGTSVTAFISSSGENVGLLSRAP